MANLASLIFDNVKKVCYYWKAILHRIPVTRVDDVFKKIAREPLFLRKLTR